MLADEERPGAEDQNELFRLLVDSVTDYAIFRLDPDGFVASWNPGAERIKGYRAEEILGRGYDAFFPPENKGHAAELLAAAAANGRVSEEGWRVRQDGSRFLAEVVLTALVDEHGRLQGFGKVTRDVTERRKLERDLEQARRMESLGRMAGGVAHDFNNLLTAILGQSALLAEHDLAPRAEQQVARIGAAAAQAARLVDQLLAFSRSRTARAERCEPLPALTTALTSLQPLLPAGVTLECRTAPVTGCVGVGATDLGRIVQNLVLNARDAVAGSGSIGIDARPVRRSDLPVPVGDLAGDDWLHLGVRDDGRGMSTDVADRCLEPFFTTKPPSEGSGLGLAIVYGIAERGGGRVVISSEAGVGTDIRVYLPLLPAAAEPERDRAVIPPQRLRVLVVDDDEAVGQYAEDVLVDAGHEVLRMLDPVAALRALAGGRFDALVADLVMPGMHGTELIARARGQQAGLRVVAVSGYTEEQVPPDVALVAKPFTPHQLVAALQS